jgi:deoxyadenosine/deoxycytidine kinase
MLAFQSRYELLKSTIQNIYIEKSPVHTIVMERSLDADYHIFAKTMFEDGTLEKIEWDIYQYVTKLRLASHGVSGVIWLDVPPKECLNRIQKRAREGEDGITLEYLCKCHTAHNEWLSDDLELVCRIENGLWCEEDMEEIDAFLF